MLLWTPPLTQLWPWQELCFCTMLAKWVQFYLHRSMFPFWKALILPSAYSLDLIYSLSALLFFFSQQGRSQPHVAHQSSMERQELDHSLGTSAGRGPCSSERTIRRSVKEGCVLTAAQHYQHKPAGWSGFLLPHARWQHFDILVFIAGLCSVVMARLHPEIAAWFWNSGMAHLFGYFKLQVSVEHISSNWV